jgi:hypothetical protein
MKKSIHSPIVNFKVLFILLLSITVVSCSNSQKGEDTKEIAEEHNDAKFEDNDKEKDAQFLVNVAEINLEEISLGQLAQKNGNTADIKELGKMMEAGHTKSLNELTSISKRKNDYYPHIFNRRCTGMLTKKWTSNPSKISTKNIVTRWLIRIKMQYHYLKKHPTNLPIQILKHGLH